MFGPLVVKLHKLSNCPSTNSLAMAALQAGEATEGHVWMADEQTAGRGQRGASWTSAPGQNLLISLVLTPGAHRKQVDLVTFNQAMALAVLGTVQALGITQAQVKWPNDVLAQHLKISGMLIENAWHAGQWRGCVVGIGLNVNQKQFELPTATSVALQLGYEVAVLDVAQVLWQQVSHWYGTWIMGQNAAIRHAYLQNLWGYQQVVRYQLPDNDGTYTGQLVGVDPNGLLQMHTQIGPQTFDLKEIKLLIN